MSVQDRRERERAGRRRLIVDAARALAETEGWDAVTTRRLSERIEYSQPVLYSHFAGRDAIVAAVAVEGFGEIAAAMRAAGPGIAEVADAYLGFAAANPALYDAMFTLAVVPFADVDTPEPLHEAFGVLREVLVPVAAGRDPGVLAEVVWAGLHGLVTLTRGGRLPAATQSARLALLIGALAPVG